MKLPCLLAGLFIFGISLFADPEIAVVLELIESTQSHLNEQKDLLRALVEFKKKRDQFVAHPTSPKLATQLVLLATELHGQIEGKRLSYLFSSDFLTEIRYFTQLAQENR